MEQSKIDRINLLAKKAKDTGLDESELKEQAKLREEYIKSFRASLKGILDNTYIQNPDGTKVKVSKREKR